jgi:hypothetical protein
MKTPNIFDDIKEKSYVVFSNKKKDLPNYYTTILNDYPGVSIKNLQTHDLFTIKVYVTHGVSLSLPNIVDGYIDLTVESITDVGVVGKIITELPEDFPLKTGSSMEVLEEEILYYVPVGNYLKDRNLN